MTVDDRGMKRVGVAARVVFALIAAPAAAADWSQAQPVTVVASDYHFSPDKLAFKRGTPYRLHIENRGKEMHEFTAPEFFKAAEIADPAVLNPDRTEIVLQPGEAKDLYFVPQQTGRFPLTCADHDWTGMVGEITVE
jgi:uncharacterized cupredoxin-like copper-binding protein